MDVNEIVEGLLRAAIRVHMREVITQCNRTSNKRDDYDDVGRQICSMFLGSLTLNMALHISPPMNGLNWNTRLIARRADGAYDITGIA